MGNIRRKERKELIERIDKATDELADVLADFGLNDHDLIETRDTIEKRVKTAQEILLGNKEV